MKNLLIVIAVCLCSTHTYSQDINDVTITKEMICRQAAVSVVSNVEYFDRTMPKDQVIQIMDDLVKEPIKDAPKKAYDLLEANKAKEEVIDILYNDFMKLDEKVIYQYLVKTNYPED